jgi:hypothetical protein
MIPPHPGSTLFATTNTQHRFEQHLHSPSCPNPQVAGPLDTPNNVGDDNAAPSLEAGRLSRSFDQSLRLESQSAPPRLSALSSIQNSNSTNNETHSLFHVDQRGTMSAGGMGTQNNGGVASGTQHAPLSYPPSHFSGISHESKYQVDRSLIFDSYTSLTEEEQTREDADAAQQAEGVIIADYQSVSDGGYESDIMSSTSTSIASSIMDFAFENGRRYHRFREGQYNFPNDDDEQEREDLKHTMVKLLCRQLHFAPIGSNPHHILDIGTGTGRWAIESTFLYFAQLF